MGTTSWLRRFRRALTKPHEALLARVLRRRAARRALARDKLGAPRGARYYDHAIRAYLEGLLTVPPREVHYRTALVDFGLDQDDADLVSQILCSAAFGTLGDWVGGDENPWWQAALRLSRSNDAVLLDQLRWRIRQLS